MSRGNKDDHFDEYVKYAKTSRGVPDEFDVWAVENNIKLPPKKDRRQDEDDDYAE